MDSKNLNNTTQKKGVGKATFLIIGLAIGMVLASILTYCIMMMSSKKTDKVEGSGYDSPEAAVEAYVNFLKEGDVEGIISTFAVESYVDNFDMAEYYDQYQQFNVFLPTGGSNNSKLYFDSNMSKDLNIECRRSYIVNGLYRHLIQIILHNTDEKEIAETINTGTVKTVDESLSVESIIRFLSTDPSLDSIEIGKFLDEKDFVNNNITQNDIYMKSQEKIWNADVEEVMVKLKIAGKDYTLFMRCVCYDGKWYIADFNNTIGLSLGIIPSSNGLVTDEDLP